MILSKYHKDNDGQIRSLVSIIVVLLVSGMIFIFFRLIYDNMLSVYTNAGFVNTSGAIKAIEGFNRGMNAFDYIVVLVMVILIIGIGITSYTLATPPMFFLLMWIFAPILGAISYFFNYIFAQVVSQVVFESTIAHFPLTILVCTNLHWVMLIAIAVGSITLYAKRDKGQYV